MNDPRMPQWASNGDQHAWTLYDAAHARTGDKGDISNIGVIAWDKDLYPMLVDQVTESAVAAHFGHRRLRSVRRYLLPKLNAMNFVLDGALDGGVNTALNLDSHGKSFAFFLLTLPIEVPTALQGLLKRPTQVLLPSPTHARSLS